jgi:hypothetical protein
VCARLTMNAVKKIAEGYASGDFTTIRIANTFGLSRRRVQQIARDYGGIRTQAEANRVVTPLKSRRRLRLRYRELSAGVTGRSEVESG